MGKVISLTDRKDMLREPFPMDVPQVLHREITYKCHYEIHMSVEIITRVWKLVISSPLAALEMYREQPDFTMV
jgi:hypothetical protein